MYLRIDIEEEKEENVDDALLHLFRASNDQICLRAGSC